MRNLVRPTLLASALSLAAGACAETAAPAPSGPGLSITVAPFDLPGPGTVSATRAVMTDACYGLTVFNVTNPGDFGPATEVWSQPSLCASQYGADGGIRFTGICDAQAAGDSHDNAIRLVLNDIYTSGTAASGGATLAFGTDFINPCPAPSEAQPDNGCVLTAPCYENQDSKIVFNLTVMRNASLGFFDAVVKFSDIFCAAKVDCVEDDGTTTLTYLPIPGTSPSVDGPTAVLGFACTAGSDAGDTFMYLDDLVVTCTDELGNVTRTATVDPSAGPGRVTPVESDPTHPVLFGAAVNRGVGSQLGTAYWNVLLGMSLDGASDETCTLTTNGTAADTDLAGGATPAHTRYPVIAWDVDLSHDTTRVCTRHPLNGGVGVDTTYTPIDARTFLARELCRAGDGTANAGAPASPDDYATADAARTSDAAQFGYWPGYLRRLPDSCATVGGRDLVNFDRTILPTLTSPSSFYGTRVLIERSPFGFLTDAPLLALTRVTITLVNFVGGVPHTTYLLGDATQGVPWNEVPTQVDSPVLATSQGGDYLQIELRTPADGVDSATPDAGIDVDLNLIYTRSLYE